MPKSPNLPGPPFRHSPLDLSSIRFPASFLRPDLTRLWDPLPLPFLSTLLFFETLLRVKTPRRTRSFPTPFAGKSLPHLGDPPLFSSSFALSCPQAFFFPSRVGSFLLTRRQSFPGQFKTPVVRFFEILVRLNCSPPRLSALHSLDRIPPAG